MAVVTGGAREELAYEELLPPMDYAVYIGESDQGDLQPLPSPTVVPEATVSAAGTSVVRELPSYTVEQWRPLVASIFPAESVDMVLSIMRCESGGNPNATGVAGERGLMQIHPLHADSTYDPEGNIRAAFRISGGWNWNAWSCKP